MKIQYKIIVLFIVASLSFWIIDALVDNFIHHDGPFWELLISDKKDFAFRSLLSVCFLVFGAIIAYTLSKQKRTEQRLKESEERFRSLAESAIDAIVSIDVHENITFWNHTAETFFNYPREEAIGQPVTLIIPERFREAHRKGLAQAIETGKTKVIGKTVELVGLRKDGSEFPMELSLSRWMSENETFFTGIIRDITGRIRAEEEISNLAKFPSEYPLPILRIKSDGTIMYANAASRALLDDWGTDVNKVIRDEWRQLVAEVFNSNRTKIKEERVNKQFLSLMVIPVVSAGYVNVYGFDITDLKNIEEQLKHHAFHDTLTGLPNRFLFSKFLSHLAEHSKRYENYSFAVLFIDLDHFKIINDSLGHPAGDQLLLKVAQRLKNCIRPVDTVARFGGDEYAVLLDNIKDVSDPMRVADRIQQELRLPFNLERHEIFVSASIGIALSSAGYGQEEDILRDADSAMYRAKELGRARYEIFDTEMHNSAMKRLQLEAELRRAVERMEFLVYYQPIVSLAEGRIIGAETLVRWQHPERGIIPPAEFIQLAEETGLILPISEWVFKSACAQNKVWQDAGHDLIIDINFSSKQFLLRNLTEMIKQELKKTGMNIQSLIVEVTESIAMEGNNIDVLNELSDMGIKTSIDDFGTGYSSLSYLIRLPVNILKIDKSFVDNVADDTHAQSIVKAIIAMAHSLDIQVIAEGVETKEQLAFLSSNQCDSIQGYLCSRPTTGDKFISMLKEGQCRFRENNPGIVNGTAHELM